MDKLKSAEEGSDSSFLSNKPFRRLKSVSNLSRGTVLLSKRSSNIHPSAPHCQPTVLIHDILTSETGAKGSVDNVSVLLEQLLKNQCQIHLFSSHQQLLKFRYKPKHLYAMIVSQKLREACESFVRNQRSSGCQFTLMTFCILSTPELCVDLDKKKINQRQNFYCYSSQDKEYPAKIVKNLFHHSFPHEDRLETLASRWSVSDFSPEKSEKKGKVHIVCEEILAEMLQNRKITTHITVSSFKTFEDVMYILNQQKQRNSLGYSYYASMKDLSSQFQTSKLDQSTKSYYPNSEAFIETPSSCFRGSKLKGVNLRQKTVIICRRFHGEIKKIRALVNSQRKIFLWQISDEATGVFQKMQEYLGIPKNQQTREEHLELESYRSYYCEDPKLQKQQKIEVNIEPIKVTIDSSLQTLERINNFGSRPLLVNFHFGSPFKKLSPPKTKKEYVSIDYIHSTLDTKIPSLMFTELPFLQPEDHEPQPLNRQVLDEVSYDVKGHLILENPKEDCVPQLCCESAWADDFYQFEPMQLPFLRPIPEEVSSLLCKSNVFLQKHLYMREFKYFSQESHLKPYLFWDWPEVIYQSQLSLSSKLQAEEEHSIILYSEANEKWIANLRSKYGDKFTWFGLEDENWIDEDGNLNTETNVVKLSNKIKLFASSFDSTTLDLCGTIQLFRLVNSDSNWTPFFKIIAPTDNNLITEISKEDLTDYYNQNPSKLIVLFIECTEAFPSQLCDLEGQSQGRLKLIYVKSQYVDSEDKLFIRFSEMEPIAKYVFKIDSEGRKNYVIFHSEQGRSQATTLIQTEKLQKVEERTYLSLRPDVQKIFSNIKGLYRKVYIVCFGDQQKEIEKIFTTYNINGQSSEAFLVFSLLHRERPPPSSLKSQSQSEQPSQEKSRLENKSLNQAQDSQGRGSLPIESRDHEQAPSKEFSKMVRIDDYQKIYIVYQSFANADEKRGLLAACTKNEKIIPVVYNSVSQLKGLRDENTLMLLMMKEVPMQLFNELIEHQQLSIIFKNCNLKAVLPKNTDINVNSILDLFQHQSVTSIKKLHSEQLTQYLTKFQSEVLQKNRSNEMKIESQLPSISSKNDSSNLTQRTNFTSMVKQMRSNQEEFSKLKTSLNKNLVVLLVDFNKRSKYTILAVKHHLIIQSYSGENNLETEIRKKIGRHVIMCIIGKTMLGKAIALKKKYANVFFFLQQTKYSEQPEEEQREFLAGEFGRSSDFEKFLMKLAGQEHSKLQSNPENGFSSESFLKSNKKSTLHQCLSAGRLDTRRLKSKDESMLSDPSQVTLSRVKSSKIRSPHQKKGHPLDESEYYQR